MPTLAGLQRPFPRTLGAGVSASALALALLVSPITAVAGNDYSYDGWVQLELEEGVSIGTIEDRYGITTADSLPPLYLMSVPIGSEAQLVFEMNLDADIVVAEYCWGNQTPEGVRQMIVIAVGGTITDYLDQSWMDRVHLADIQAHTKGDGVRVAVIDTGVKADHPALEGAILPGIDFVDNDDDPSEEANGVDDNDDGTIDGGAGHGTMVAGIVHLVAPNAGILPIRALTDEGTGKTWYVAKAIRYAVDHGADIINLSLGLTNRVHVITHEIERAAAASVLMVSAAGNNNQEYPPFFPASQASVLSVAALDSSDVKAEFSNYHPSVDLSAPGVGILAPYHDGEYAIGAGTSFSTPFVSGQCALIKAANPDLTFGEIQAIAALGVENIYGIPGNESYYGKLGSGRFDGLQTWLQIPVPPTTGAGGTRVDVASIAAVPNPSTLHSGVRITFAAGQPQPAEVLIVDSSGRLVRRLSARGGEVAWDGRTDGGATTPAGVYFVRPPVESGREATAWSLRVVRTVGD